MVDPLLAQRLAGASIAVIGDIMLDHHVYGRVNRLSDEAPVPILHVRSERYMLGGAANVAANAAALGGSARLVGLVGDDAPGQQLVRMIENEHGRRIAPHFVMDRARPTALKTRYLGGQQQIVRVDREEAAPATKALEARLIDEIEDAVEACDVIVASDYGKGVLTDVVLAALFKAAAAANKPVLVDPKRAKFADYRGATLITPNRKELTGAVGLPCESDEQAALAAEAAIAEAGASILLTRSEKGMGLYRKDQAPVLLGAEAREVFDVSGAGDTVVATFALALAAGLSMEQAMRLANAAAGVVVMKLGTATVSTDELIAALRPRRDATLASLTALPEAKTQRAAWAAQGLTVGFANGCFDLLHPGHVSLISQAAEACDRLILALNDDESVSRLKGPTRPVQKLDARAAVIGAIKGVDLVVSFAEDTPLELIRALQPDVLIKGEDYREDQVVGADIVKARGGRVLLAKLTAGQSTSAIVKRAGKD
jgi:D-beta-D-heptose 7-phosphate kinase/D-beta-D-heptose 1-phosphate adenosyltransferase